MAVKMNLLPPELTVDKNLSTILKTLRSVGIVSIVVFIIFVAGLGGFFIFDSIILRNLNSDIDSLKGQISAQETSEQQVVLLKDRINKIGIVKKTPDSLNNLIAIDPFLPPDSNQVAVNELSIDPTKINLLLNFKNNSDLSAFFDNLSGSDVFKSVTLSSFGLSPLAGYSVGITIQTK